MASPQGSQQGSNDSKQKKNARKKGSNGGSSTSTPSTQRSANPPAPSPLANAEVPGSPLRGNDRSSRSSTPTQETPKKHSEPERLTEDALRRLNAGEQSSPSSPPKPAALETFTGTKDDSEDAEKEEEDSDADEAADANEDDAPSSDNLKELALKLVEDAFMNAVAGGNANVGKTAAAITTGIVLKQLGKHKIAEWQKALLKHMLDEIVEKARKKFFPDDEKEGEPSNDKDAKKKETGKVKDSARREDNGKQADERISHRQRGKLPAHDEDNLSYQSSRDVLRHGGDTPESVVPESGDREPPLPLPRARRTRNGNEGSFPDEPRPRRIPEPIAPVGGDRGPPRPQRSQMHALLPGERTEPRQRRPQVEIPRVEPMTPMDVPRRRVEEPVPPPPPLDERHPDDSDGHRRRRRRRRRQHHHRASFETIFREVEEDIVRVRHTVESNRIHIGVELFEPGALVADKEFIQKLMHPFVQLLKDIFRPAPKPRVYIEDEDRKHGHRRRHHHHRRSGSNSNSHSRRERPRRDYDDDDDYESEYIRRVVVRKRTGSESIGGLFRSWR